MNEILKEIQSLLLANFVNVEENWGQINLPEPAIEYPCFLIDCESVTYSNLGNNIRKIKLLPQEAVINIELTIAINRLKDVTQSQEGKEWFIFELMEEAHHLLQGKTVGNGKLIRTELKRIKREDGLQEYCITYKLAAHNV